VELSFHQCCYGEEEKKGKKKKETTLKTKLSKYFRIVGKRK